MLTIQQWKSGSEALNSHCAVDGSTTAMLRGRHRRGGRW